jgi:hypothetical protein
MVKDGGKDGEGRKTNMKDGRTDGRTEGRKEGLYEGREKGKNLRKEGKKEGGVGRHLRKAVLLCSGGKIIREAVFSREGAQKKRPSFLPSFFVSHLRPFLHFSSFLLPLSPFSTFLHSSFSPYV